MEPADEPVFVLVVAVALGRFWGRNMSALPAAAMLGVLMVAFLIGVAVAGRSSLWRFGRNQRADHRQLPSIR